jgi:hypothetical protein
MIPTETLRAAAQCLRARGIGWSAAEWVARTPEAVTTPLARWLDAIADSVDLAPDQPIIGKLSATLMAHAIVGGE